MTRRYLTKGYDLVNGRWKEAGSAERVASFEERQRKLGRKGRKVWATIEEHEEIKKLLEKMRN